MYYVQTVTNACAQSQYFVMHWGLDITMPTSTLLESTPNTADVFQLCSAVILTPVNLVH